MTDRTELMSRLVSLVGDLQPGPSTSAADLDVVRRLAADAVVGGMSVGGDLSTHLAHSDVAALAPLLESATSTETRDMLVSRRTLPVLSTQPANSLPAWASGRAIERTIGPFRDRLGRNVWIDLFRIVRQVRFVRTAGGAPFLTLPLSLSARAAPLPTPTRYTIPAGSIWIASRQFATGAPASSYTGLKISGGTLELTQPIAITGDEVVGMRENELNEVRSRISRPSNGPLSSTVSSRSRMTAGGSVVKSPICSNAAVQVVSRSASSSASPAWR